MVHAKAAASFISHEQAGLNLKELGENTFEQIKEQGRDKWNEVLGKIVVEDDNIDNVKTFYSCLYRSALFPRSFYEINDKGETGHSSLL